MLTEQLLNCSHPAKPMGESPLQTRGATYRTVSTARDSKHGHVIWSRSIDSLRRLERVFVNASVFVEFVALTMSGHGANAAQPNGHEAQQSGIEGRQADEFLKKVFSCFSAVA